MSQDEENEKLLTHAEVKTILEKSLEKPDKIYHGPEKDFGERRFMEERAEEEGEEGEIDPLSKLSFEKRAAMEHVSTFMRISAKTAKKMIEELIKIERVTEVHAYKIAELMPRDETELRQVFAKDRFTLQPEELKAILEIIDAHRE